MGFLKRFFARYAVAPQDPATLKKIDTQLQTRFRDFALLQQALTHTSFTNENPKLRRPDNERLELLGDAVIDLAITARLMKEFPMYHEGDLSKLRSALVSEKPLAEIARKFGVGDYLYLGKGESQSQGASKPSLLANTYEAIIGALFVDRGFSWAEKIVNLHFAELILQAQTGRVQSDFKTLLQEKIQGRFQIPPKYVVLRQVGPDHQKVFEVAIQVRDTVYGIGKGASKKEAEQEAARLALENLQEAPKTT